MKKTKICVCFLLFSIYRLSSLCAAAEEPDPVRDTNGEEVRAGVDYYIVSVIRGGGGGGLTLASTGNKTCPLDVVQEPSDLNRGLPLYFHPVNPKKGVVRVSTDQNIIFNASTLCLQSTVWQLYYDESFQRFFITTAGVEGNPGIETISNWFKIEEFGSDYKLVFCPTVCDFCRPVCGDIAIFWEDVGRRLVLTTNERPFIVKFVKV